MIRTISLLGVLAAGLTSCDGNPVSEGRNEVSRLIVNPVVLTLTVNGEKKVAAYAVNRYGEATFDGVTAQACDARVTVRQDSSLLPFEPPTRIIARGVTAGTSCITFSGAGQVDSVRVVVQ